MTTPTQAEVDEREARNRAELDRLNARPWRGVCPACPSRMWCADTEEEARTLVGEHIATEHPPLLPTVWQDHPTAEEEAAASAAGTETAPERVAHSRMAIDPDGKVKPVSEFSADERWWCDGEDCGRDLGYPHVHPYTGPARRVDLLTGRETERTCAIGED